MRHVPLLLAMLCCACSQANDGPDPVATQASAGPESTTAASPAEPVAEPSASASQGTLGPEGLGDIVVGKAPPASLKTDAVQISDGCQTHTDKARGIYAMTDGKVVTRITAMRASEVKTARGIGLGASEGDVRRAYPYADAEPHKYVAGPAKYLDWRPVGGGEAGLRFEIGADGKVSMIHAGRDPYLSYVEGCA